MKSWVYLLFSLLLIMLFQNCTQGDDFRSQTYVVRQEATIVVVADDEIADDIDGLLNGELSDPPVPSSSTLSPLACFQSYISVFEWKNPSANLMNEKPVLGDQKIVTLKMNSNGYTTAIDAGWAIEGEIKIKPDGSSSSSVQFLKQSLSDDDFLDCYFMRVPSGDTNTLAIGKANVLLPDIGSDPAANIFSGFLRYKEQFIACRVRSGRKNIELKNMNQSSTFLTYSQPFVIKRGCYQNPQEI